ncbi:MAG: hypothetical protein R3C28_14150 [Pirellulaceae bacterium]
MPTTAEVLSNLNGYPRTLAWSNFAPRATSPSPPFSAQTGSAFRWRTGGVTLRNGIYRFSSVRVDVSVIAAATWRDMSWYNNAGTADRQRLLVHEQGHFEITGLCARDLCRELMSLEMSDDVVGVLRGVGDSAAARLQYANRKMNEDAHRKASEIQALQQWLENAVVNGSNREGQYERDTNHGQNAHAQHRWTQIFRMSLDQDIPLSLVMAMHNCSSSMGTNLQQCMSNTAPSASSP